MKRSKMLIKIMSYKELYLMMIPGLAFFVIFAYAPMYGVIIAFKQFVPSIGILKSPWIGLANFKSFFTSESFYTLTFNTIIINLYKIAILLPFSVFLAICLDQLRSMVTKRVTQAIMFLPYFVSWIIIDRMLYGFMDPSNGTIAHLLRALGIEMFNFYGAANIWRGVIAATYVWRWAGYYSIIFFAAICGINQDLFEAARVDGASRLRQIISITIPSLMPTFVILLLLQLGLIMKGNFGQVYALVGMNSALYSKVDVLDTFVYRGAFLKGDFSYPAAIGLYQAVVGMILVLSTNYYAKRKSYATIF